MFLETGHDNGRIVSAVHVLCRVRLQPDSRGPPGGRRYGQTETALIPPSRSDCMRPLDPDRWRTLSPHLDAALEIDPEQRPAWLAALGQSEPDVVADLKVLLAGCDAIKDSGFLEGVVEVGVRQAPPSLSGQVLGAYRLLSLIGQG